MFRKMISTSWSWLSSRIDFLVFLTCIVVVYAFSVKFNFLETLVTLANKFGKWQLDELLPTSIYVALALAYISFKRRQALVKSKSLLERQNTRLQKTLEDFNQAMASYRRSTHQIRSIYEAAPVGIGVVADRVFQDVNEQFCEISGYSKDELIGQSSNIVLPSKEHFELAGQQLVEAANKKGGNVFDSRLKRKDGEIISVLLGLTPINSEDLSAGITFTAMDITERKLMEDALLKSEERYRKFFEEDITGDALTAVDGEIIDCNPAFARIFGYESAEEIMTVNEKRLYPFGRDAVLQRLEEEKMIERIEIEFVHREKRPVYCIGNLVGLFDPQGSLTHVRAYYFDDTKRVQLEKSIRESQKMKALGTLAGGIAHDFNNLLQSILGSAQLLKGELPAETPLREDVDRIINVSLQARVLIKQIVAFSRRSDHHISAVRFQDVLQDVIRLCRSTIPPNIQIHYAIQEDCPAVMGDPVQLQQVAMNLIINAFHAVEKINGRISVRLKEEVIEGQNAVSDPLGPGRFAVFSVSDTGGGIDDSIIEKIFEPYFTTKEQGKGTGLGLSVVYGIVKEYNGDIRVYSEAGKGSTFKAFLPVAPVSDEDSERRVPEATERGVGKNDR